MGAEATLLKRYNRSAEECGKGTQPQTKVLAKAEIRAHTTDDSHRPAGFCVTSDRFPSHYTVANRLLG